MREIESLIPHRNPFLYVDEILSFSREEIVGVKIFSSADAFLAASFPEFNYVPGVVLVESMAQCGGAGVKKLGFSEGLFALAGIDSAQFLKGLVYEKTFTMVIKNIRLSNKLIKQSGVGYCDNAIVVEASWTCVRIQ
ncbi:3-hydroxyacyl-ACP dehydratase FabZ family protein [Chryseolinea lacunae]|uniref:Beta-hydroxyacyl-ACP dehydratase n=1 Tax=Chryseolinea lacunae TaxID=2801331 RepID=A0ABS1KQW5_9BACT|nr:3-hydroxyacyl-ACP dehydratase FabZ family protein [Chryseolinea lacunae]MBL0741865.1 beta-hydroxyacyl-ACP dehydratase [Chryseolinea lacunae]